jgi:hypothetical protein
MGKARGSRKDGIPRERSVGEETFALHCQAYNLDPEREFVFAPDRLWRFDFAWPAHRIAVEVEGGTRKMGRHQFHGGFTADCEKYNRAASLGWRVLRYTTEMVTAGMAIDDVRALLPVIL